MAVTLAFALILLRAASGIRDSGEAHEMPLNGRKAAAPELSDVILSYFKTGDRSAACQQTTGYQRVLTLEKVKMSLLAPALFCKIQESLNYNQNEYVTAFHGGIDVKGAGSGLSGAVHLFTKVPKIYMKTIDNTEAAILEDTEEGAFLPDYMEHVAHYPRTLLTHMLDFFKIEYDDGRMMKVLVMDNFKRYINFGTDQFLDFDLKGSRFKRRIGSDGGRRCTMPFPFEFLASNPHQGEGEDGDWYALRTQVPRGTLEYFAKEEADRFRQLPMHDDCLGGLRTGRGGLITDPSVAAAVKWIEKQGDPCGKLLQLCQSASAATQSPIDCSFLQTVKCSNWLNGVAGEKKARKLLLGMKVAVEGMRKFFGFPSPMDDHHDEFLFDQVPMSMTPCARELLNEQLQEDTAFLNEHKLMDYSLGLVVKYVDQPLRTPRGTNLLEGIPSVGEEKALYFLKIIDILAPWTTKKGLSQTAQGVVAWGKTDEASVPSLVGNVLESFFVKQKLTRCGAEVKGVCISDCCSYSDPKSMCEGGSTSLAAFRWLSTDTATWIKQGTDLEACDGSRVSIYPADGVKDTRVLCAAKDAHLSLDATPWLPSSIRSMPLEDMCKEVDFYLKDPNAQAYLYNVLGFSLLQNVTWDEYRTRFSELLRVALFAYLDIARKPQLQDTMDPNEYALRFDRFVLAWTSQPSGPQWGELTKKYGNLCEKV